MLSQTILSLFLLTSFCSYSFGFFGNKKCKDECGGEAAHDEAMKSGTLSCYWYRSWFFGIKLTRAATDCEIKSCKLGEEKPAEDQTKCWCEMCNDPDSDNSYFCFAPGEEQILVPECYNQFCPPSASNYRPKEYEGETRPAKYFGSYCKKYTMKQ